MVSNLVQVQGEFADHVYAAGAGFPFPPHRLELDEFARTLVAVYFDWPQNTLVMMMACQGHGPGASKGYL